MTSIRSNGPRDFPRIAKEMGFSFSLRRGRVDWHRIGSIDIDRLVQDRDLVSLQENLISVINYNLDSEYDVKILDPNFVKLFKLAQLSIDYLMYSEQHLYNCIELDQEQLQKYIKELDKLRRECKKKDDEIKIFKKKLKASLEKKNEVPWHQHYRSNSGEAIGNFYQCTHCGKKFLTASFLEGHHRRRHPGMPFSMPLDPLTRETERLQSEIKELKERLNSTERLIHRESDEQLKVVTVPSKEKGDEQRSSKTRNWAEEEKKKLEAWQEAQQRKYLDEIAELKAVFYTEIKRLKEKSPAEASTSPSKTELLEQIRKQEEELANLRERVSGQSTPDLENVQGRLEAQERFWKSRLKQIETQHMKEIEELKIQLDHARETQNKSHNAEYENTIHELIVHAARQDAALKTQAEQILQLTEVQAKQRFQSEESKSEAAREDAEQVRHSQEPMSHVEPTRDGISNEVTPDPATTFAKLAARIDNAIRISKRSSDHSDSAKEMGKAVVNEQFTESLYSSSKKFPSVIENRRRSQSPEQTVITPEKIPIVPSKPSGITETTDSEEESSSEAEDIAMPSMYGQVDTRLLKQKYTLPNKAWNEKEPSGSLEGSKDSGLDSPKRQSVAHVSPVTKIIAFHKPTSVISVSEDKVDSVVDSDSQDEDAEEEEEVEEDEEDEEEETSGEEETNEESETETEAAAQNELAVKSIESSANTVEKKRLREDLQELLARRLRELGVDPEWKGIPGGSFKQKMGILNHHQNITAKTYKSFFRIKKKMVEELEKRVVENETRSKMKSKNDEKKKDNSSQNKMAVKKFVGKMKTKALSVLKRSTSKDTKNATGTLLAQPARSPHKTNTQTGKGIVVTSTKQTRMPSQNTALGNSKTNRTAADRRIRKPDIKSETSGKVIGRSTPEKPKVTVVTSTPKKSIEIPVASPRGSILKGQKPVSVSKPEPIMRKKEVENQSTSTEEEEEEDEEETEAEVPTTASMKQTILQPTPVQQRPASASSIITFRNQGFSSDQDYPTENKSALKSSSSMGSITKKKKVLFADQDTDSEDSKQTRTLPKPWNTAKVTTVARLSKSSDALAVKPSSQSSLRSSSNASSIPGPSTSKTSDSDSDWGLSSVQDNTEEALKETEDIGSVSKSSSYERINLRTKQSAKIAEISKNIEEQLRMARSKPPTGGVETMFRANNQSTSSISFGSLISDNLENNMNVANSSVPTQKQPSSSKLTPSDWDLEDFDD